MASVRNWFMHLIGRSQADAPGGASSLESNMRVNTYHGVAQVLTLNMVQPFLGIFAVKLGATNYQIALLSSAPAVVSLLAMIPGARFIDRFPRKKRVTMGFLLAHRAFFLGLACLPFFVADRRAAVLVALVALMNFPGAIGHVAWQSFISGIIPAQMRPQAFAHRNRLMNLVGTCVVLVAGRLLDLISYPLSYQIVFVFAFLFALAEMWVLAQVDEEGGLALVDSARTAAGTAGAVRAAAETGTIATKEAGGPDVVAGSLPQRTGRGLFATLAGTIREVLSHRSYVRYTAASIYFYFAWQTAWPLFTLYQVRVLGANNLWVSILNLTNTGGALVGYGFWARYATRNGNLRTLFASSAGIFIVPAVYAFSHSLYTVAIFNLVMGAIFSGVNLSLFNALLDTTPERHRTSYIAYYQTLVNVSAIVAPMAGVALLNTVGFMWAFLASAALRITGSLAFLVIDVMEARERKTQVAAASRAQTLNV